RDDDRGIPAVDVARRPPRGAASPPPRRVPDRIRHGQVRAPRADDRRQRARVRSRAALRRRHDRAGRPERRVTFRLASPWWLLLLAVIPLLWRAHRPSRRRAAVRFPTLAVLRAVAP